MSKELISKYNKRIYLGTFSIVLGSALGIYFLFTLIELVKAGKYQGVGMLYLNVLIFDISCIIFPGTFLCINFYMKKREMFRRSEITEKDFEELKSLIYYYLKTNEGKAFTNEVLKDKLKNTIKNRLVKLYFEENFDKVLKDMIIEGSVKNIQKDGKDYFVLS